MFIFKSVFDQCLSRDYLYPYMNYMYENVFSNMYISQEEVKKLYAGFADNDLAQTILSVPSISAFNRDIGGVDNSTFEINITSELFFYLLRINANGIYSPFINGILVTKDLKDVLLHEHVHQFNQIVFKNECNPYSTLKQASSYYKAIFLTLRDINAKLGAGIDNTVKYFSSNQDFARAIIKSLKLDCGKILPDPDILVQDDSTENKKFNDKLKDFLKTPFEPRVEDILNFMDKDLNQDEGSVDNFDIEETPIVPVSADEQTAYSDKLIQEMIDSFKTPPLLPELINLDGVITLVQEMSERDATQVVQDIIYVPDYGAELGVYMNFMSGYLTKEYEQFLCIYEVYPNMHYDSETIAKFYQLSVDSDVKDLFPHIYKYHQEVIVPSAEEYYLNNTNQCPIIIDSWL